VSVDLIFVGLCTYDLNSGLITSGKIKLLRTTTVGREKVFKAYVNDGVIGMVLMFVPNSCYPMTAQAETICHTVDLTSDVFLKKQSYSHNDPNCLSRAILWQ